jgi:hypothetical protein
MANKVWPRWFYLEFDVTPCPVRGEKSETGYMATFPGEREEG